MRSRTGVFRIAVVCLITFTPLQASSQTGRLSPLTDNQPTLAIGAIAIKPDNKQVVLAGTGEGNATADSYYGLGILRSSNGGSSWSLVTSADSGAHPLEGLGFSRIVFNPDNPAFVV